MEDGWIDDHLPRGLVSRSAFVCRGGRTARRFYWRDDAEPRRASMKYLSVCSGIEAASVAWHPLGWQPVGFSEIDAFPSAVLAHRFPKVVNYGDITDFRNWPIRAGDIDLLVGGTPCQSFSVAGLRRGLADPRGNIMLAYLALAEHLRPKWIVWENVPGVLSSGRGRDFGTLLGALGQLGYGYAFRVLDAQWVRTQRHSRAVPQRRRRVFVVGCLGDTASAAAVLFESESMQRHSSPRATAGKDIAGTIAARFGISRNNYEECVTVNTPFDLQSFGQYGNGDVGSTCKSRDHKDSTDVVVIDRAAFNQGVNASYDPHIAITNVMDPLVARGPHAVAYETATTVTAFAQNCREEVRDLNNVAGALSANEGSHQRTLLAYTKAKRAQSATDDESWVDGVVAPTQNAFDVGDTRATTAIVSTAILGGFDYEHNAHGPNDPTGPLLAGSRSGGGHPLPAIVVAIPIHDQATRWAGKHGDKSDGKGNGFGVGQVGDPSPTLTQGDKHAVGVIAFHPTHAVAVVAPTLTATNDPSRSPQSSEVTQQVASVVAATGGMTVRRLTPRECERLQGFPDDWTLVPWRKGMATDGNRYKAIGNSMAVNCMEWIGERIAAVEAR